MRKLIVTFSLLLIVALLAPSVIAQENRALWSLSTYIQSAKIIYQHEYRKDKSRKTLYKAIDLLREASSRYNKVPEIHFTLGTFFAEINELDTMIAYFDSTKTLCDDESIDKKYRKRCYSKDKYIEKIEDFRQKYWEESYNDAVEFLRQYDTVVVMKSMAPTEDSAAVLDSLKTLAFNMAEESFQQAIQMKPADPKSYDGYGVILEREDRYLEAIQKYKQAMSMVGESENDISKIAYAFISIPEWDSSAFWFEKFLEYQPENTSALINLAICYNSLNDYDKSYVYTEKLLEIDPENTQALFNAGQYWFLKMQDAAAAMAEITDSIPDAEAKQQELDALTIENRIKSEGFFERAIAVNPEDVDALKRLGILYLLSQQTEKAADTFEKYIAIDPTDSDILDYLGRAYIQLGQFDKAIKPYEMQTEINPGNVDALTRLEELYRHAGQIDKADELKVKIEELEKL